MHYVLGVDNNNKKNKIIKSLRKYKEEKSQKTTTTIDNMSINKMSIATCNTKYTKS